MDTLLIDKLFNDYYGMFIFANYLGIILPIIIVGIPRFRTIRNITLAAIIALLALWVNRYIIVVPTLETPFIPIQDVRMEWIRYAPTWVEWALTGAGISIYALFFMVAAKLAPIISISEMKEAIESKND
jgi:molybdopterin-containing oxidoreductase family membrane subunit